MTSCQKKSDDATFLKDLKDHIDEFIHVSMDEHKTCLKNTIQKMSGMSKFVAERSAVLLKPRKLKLKALCLFRPVSFSRMRWLMAACLLPSGVCGHVELNNQSISNTVIAVILALAVYCFLFRVI